MDIKNEILKLAAENKQRVIEFRHYLHAHPELSFQEYDTAKFISKVLEKYGIEHQTGVADTGIVAYVRGKNADKRTIALRADIDALPIKEENEVPYKSKNEGVMHACGHDVHSSSLLGTAIILNNLNDHFEGTVKMLFQPGEEKIPGGATLMIKAGALESPKPKSILGQHVMPYLPVGTIGFREGMYMASADEIYITIIGKGGHAAMPENLVDPVAIQAQMITALQQVISRNAPPKIPSVLSFGKIEANGATNVIPNEVYIEGTFRTMNEEWRNKAHTLIKKVASGICESFGAECKIEVRKGYPYLENEPGLTKRMKEAAIELLGKDKVVDLDIWLAGEDFAFYSQIMDACFYRLGVANEAKGITSGVHTPTFNIDEDALEIGSALMAWLAVKELEC
ncbi:amidohydrolase [Hyphobacterium sp. CCMP332]|nr:amidohydrolase [Hyphobacterium sp. CCMP332]